jgi:hypothetical protein
MTYEVGFGMFECNYFLSFFRYDETSRNLC